MSRWRDLEPAPAEDASGSPSRSVIAVIGIDRYPHWQRLTNAVSDARGAAALFERLGFERVTEPLLDERATGDAIQQLVTDDLARLGPDDSLVLFYSGHGGTRKHQLGSQVVKTGYLIPADASDKVATWIELDGWLRAVSLLPPKHILVILDACHSGIALGAIIKWRDTGTWQDTPLSTLEARRSRRIITSALDDQLALDSGPVHGHSLFTGCLIEGLTHGLGRTGSRVATGSELGLYLQRRVATYPSSQQTPDFGTFDFDDRGEMLIPLALGGPGERVAPLTPPPRVGPEAEVVPTTRPEPAPPQARRRRGLIAAGGASLALVLVLAIVASRTPGPRPPADAAIAGAPSGAPAQAPPARPATIRFTPGRCPAEMVWIPGATFRLGSPAGEGEADEHPQREVTLSGYCLDRMEVTVGAYAVCAKARGCSEGTQTASWSEGQTPPAAVELVSRFCNGADRAEHPMNCVDWGQASAYCRWHWKRLPTEAEWEYAARGSDGRRYPWGNQEPSAERLNACGSECLALAKRMRSEDAKGMTGEEKGMYGDNDGAEMTAPAGRYRAGASPFGALDMAGNVREWTDDWYAIRDDHAWNLTGMTTTNPRNTYGGSYRVNRGGAWIDVSPGAVRAADRDADLPTNRLPFLGFRCALGE